MKVTIKALEKAVAEFKENLYQTTQIILMNSEDFLRIVDLKDYPDNVFFICNPHVEKGCAFVLKNSPLKRDIYNLCCEHPDIVLRGRKV